MLRQQSVDEPLAAVDVERRAGDGGVGHDVDGHRGEICRRDHPADGQRGAQLLAPVLECGLVAVEERRRQRGVDEAGLDQVDADWRELERERRGERPQQ